MATSRVQVTEGSGKSLATHSFSEDAVTKEISRVNLNTSGGVETGVAASPLQVSLANTGANATSVVVDLGSNNDITGTVTANLSATDNAVLDAIAADTAILAAAVATEVQVDVVSSALPTGAATSAKQDTIIGHVDGIETLLGTIDADTSNLSTKIDTVAGDTTSIQTAVELIDDTVFAEDVAAQAADKGVAILAVRRDADTSLVGADNDYANLQVNANGALKVEAFSGEALPVTQSGTWDEVGINDSGNSITVDGTITADLGATDNAVLDAIAASTAAIETAVEGTLTVTGGGGGTEYTEDAAAAANPVGNALILVREDGRAGSLTTADGDNVALRGNNKGEAYVKTTDSDALLTTIDADTGNISTKIDTIAGAVAGAEMQVDVLTMPTVAVTQSGTWDEVGINDSGNSITVDYATTGSGTATGALRVELPTNGTGVLASVAAVTEITNALPAGTNAIGKLAANSGVDIGDVDVTTVGTITPGTAASSLGKAEDAVHATGDVGVMALGIRRDTAAAASGTTGDYEPFSTDSSGRMWVNISGASVAAGTNAIGNVGLIGRTTGGLSIFRSLDIDESEEEIKASAGQLFSISAFNRTAAPLYLKFYNATAASVTVGSTTPVLTFVVPGNADSDGAGFVWNNEIGFAFATAISVACTTGIADADTGAPGANDCVINIGYM